MDNRIRETIRNTSKIYDNHVHTQYAYCSQNNMLPQTTVKIAKDKGCGICLVEHAGQLYVTSEDYWSANFINNPELIYNNATNRMDEFIDYISQYKDEDVLIGLELDINTSGKIALRDNHLNSFDIFIGAVHNIPERFNELDKGFLWNIDVYCDYKVDILAHPFRIYKQKKIPRPTHLYQRVAKALRDNGIAAELNFHINEPDLNFFKICIENGVKIAFGSDAHKLSEVCSFEQNIELLRSIYDGNLEDILFDIGNRS